MNPMNSLLAAAGLTIALSLAPPCLLQQAYGQRVDPYLQVRLRMVRKYIEADGINNKAVLKSVRSVPRHLFCLPSQRRFAYLDGALPIGYRQTISPPFVVSYMTQTIDPQPTDKVLEIGTGSGYQAAVLSGIVKDVYTIEIVPQLGRTAAARLKKLGYTNVHTKVGDGYKGWPDKAPFDKIIVTCSPEKVPQALKDQLKEGGKLLIPIGERYQQVFHLFEKKDGKLTQKKLISTLFVPMTGISEDKRKQKPDPANPRIINGSFEIDENKDGLPDNFHYQRQVTISSGGAPDGKKYVTVRNTVPGQRAQLLQGMAIDGRRVKRLRITMTVRYSRLGYGTKSYHRPGLHLHFYNGIRKRIGAASIGPFRGSRREWRTITRVVTVSPLAREAVLQVGLNGGTGIFEIDNIKITPVR